MSVPYSNLGEADISGCVSAAKNNLAKLISTSSRINFRRDLTNELFSLWFPVAYIAVTQRLGFLSIYNFTLKKRKEKKRKKNKNMDLRISKDERIHFVYPSYLIDFNLVFLVLSNFSLFFLPFLCCYHFYFRAHYASLPRDVLFTF